MRSRTISAYTPCYKRHELALDVVYSKLTIDTKLKIVLCVDIRVSRYECKHYSRETPFLKHSCVLFHSCSMKAATSPAVYCSGEGEKSGSPFSAGFLAVMLSYFPNNWADRARHGPADTPHISPNI